MKGEGRPRLSAFFLLILSAPAISFCNHGRPCVQPRPFLSILGNGSGGEPFGATDINAVTGNRSLTVAENRQGTITVFKWPNPSYYDHVKYMTTTRDAPRMGALPNEGVMTGLYYETASSRGFFWLRDKAVGQRYLADDGVEVLTNFVAPELGLELETRDFVTPRADLFWREFSLHRAPDSPVAVARLVAYFNFSPQVDKFAYLPIRDWCLDNLGFSRLVWDKASQVFIQSRRRPAAGDLHAEAHIAFGLDGSASSHQAGFDRACGGSRLSSQADAFDLAGQGTLPGSDSATGRVTAGLIRELEFDGEGTARTAVLIAAAESEEEAVRRIEEGREKGFSEAERETTDFWRELLKTVPRPATPDERIRRVALRSLVVLILGSSREGPTVASISTQPPYGLDWMRDGAYTNLALMAAGFPELVRARCLFWAEVQSSLTNPLPFVPPGNWAANYFADGTPGFPLIWWEIDETGFALWSLVNYYQAAGDRGYLRQVWPAIRRAADFLVRFRDPVSKLPLPAWEDDNPRLRQSLHGAVPVYLGLKAASAAAAVQGDRASQIRWETRAQELKAAVLEHFYDPLCGRWVGHPSEKGKCGRMREGNDFGLLLWPAEMLAPGDPRAEQAARQVWAALEKSYNGECKQGMYELYGLLMLARFWKDRPEKLPLLKRGLAWSAAGPVTDTGLIGEIWFWENGRYIPGQSQPQLWHHALFYLAALALYGEEK